MERSEVQMAYWLSLAKRSRSYNYDRGVNNFLELWDTHKNIAEQ